MTSERKGSRHVERAQGREPFLGGAITLRTKGFSVEERKGSKRSPLYPRADEPFSDRTVAAPEPSPSAQLVELARDVERLGVSGRTDPEQTVLAKHTIARALRRIAARIDR